jgi:hypothetical protein
MVRNLAPAADLGMVTVWVRGDSELAGLGRDAVRVDYVVDDLVGWLEGIAADLAEPLDPESLGD